MTEPKEQRCYGCASLNPAGQAYCGACGEPLALPAYLSKNISAQVAVVTREKSLVETETAARVFERVIGWFRLAAISVTVVTVVIGIFFTFKFRDLYSAVDKAKQSVTSAQQSVSDESIKDVAHVRDLAANATIGVAGSQEALARKQQLVIEQMGKQADAVTTDVKNARAQIDAAARLEPDMRSLQSQLKDAQGVLAEQQKLLTDSEEYTQKVLSSRKLFLFDLKTMPASEFAIIPPPSGSSQSVLFVLLPDAVLHQTMQLQQYVTTQPPNSYFFFHNLMIFFWGDPAENLKNKPFTATYFADTRDKVHLKVLEVRNGRIYADGQPLPKFNQPDPDGPDSIVVHQ